MIKEDINIKNLINKRIQSIHNTSKESAIEDLLYTTHKGQTYEITLCISKVKLVKEEFTLFNKLSNKVKELLE